MISERDDSDKKGRRRHKAIAVMVAALFAVTAFAAILTVTAANDDDGFSEMLGAGGTAPMVAAGDDHSLALKSDGTVWSWGDNNDGQLGDGTTTNRSTPVQVLGPGGTGFLTGVTAIAAAYNHSLALKSDGTVWAWGNNGRSQLGDGTTTNRSTPVQVLGPGGTGFLTDVTAIAVGSVHSVALKSDGTVWAWGGNSEGRLGDGTTTNRSTPVQVLGPGGVGFLTDVTAIGVVGGRTFALKSNGMVWGWGWNYRGELGDGTTTSRSTPVQVLGPGGVGFLTDVTVIAGSSAIRSDGTVWRWGPNDSGQLGDGTTTDSSTPVQVLGPGGVGFLTDVTAIGVGFFHSYALKGDGTMWAWGYNHYGQLGDGTTTDSSTPVQVLGPGGTGFLTGVTAIAAKSNHNILVLKCDGTVWAWGYNEYGQLGDGTSTNRSTPIRSAILFPPVITTSLLPGGTVGTAYSQTLVATGLAPMTWAVEMGSLPSGLNLSSAGVISGTPSEKGMFIFIVNADNGDGIHKSIFIINVGAADTRSGDGDTPGDGGGGGTNIVLIVAIIAIIAVIAAAAYFFLLRKK